MRLHKKAAVQPAMVHIQVPVPVDRLLEVDCRQSRPNPEAYPDQSHRVRRPVPAPECRLREAATEDHHLQ